MVSINGEVILFNEFLTKHNIPDKGHKCWDSTVCFCKSWWSNSLIWHLKYPVRMGSLHSCLCQKLLVQF